MSKGSIALIGALATVLAALVSVMASVGAGYYSAIRQCNQDASSMETQLTSILLEISSREERMKALLTGDEDKIPGDTLNKELTLVESGAEGHYGDPIFKQRSLVSLVNQYNRLLRRVRFPEGFCPTQSGCAGAEKGLAIDTLSVHPAIETLQITGAKANSYRQYIDKDLQEIVRQQVWHRDYGPVRLCSPSAIISADEPWKLILLKERKKQ
jgi:hypothetical protein